MTNRAGDSDGDAPVPVSILSARLRICVLFALVPVTVFSLACLVYNAPPSPVKVRLGHQASSVLEPYFGQDWELFAPTPGTSNDRLYLEAELLPKGSVAVVTTQPVEVEYAIDRMPRSNRLLPSKLPGVLLAFQEAADQYTRTSNGIDKASKDMQPAMRKDLDAQFAPSFDEMQRFLSARAATLYPGAKIVAIRATFKRQDIVPFSQRYVAPTPHEPEKPELQTSWMPYVDGVEK
ncbi:hypothetical protein ABIA35_009721 [Catenulispora sp. MAP12-49]|uniref:DUF5819 family protein n=1 Tax=Catenulispora sp. MAP12-49 TaxID=3156302 RepID=UPI00351756AF